MLSDLAYISEWATAIVALLCYKKYRHTAMQPIVFILWIVVAIEVCARIESIRIEGTNHIYYNAYIITIFPLLYYTIYKHTLVAHRKKRILIISAITIAIILLRAVTASFLTHFMIYMYILAMIALVINLLIYAVDLLKTNMRIVLKNRLDLFIFSGFLIFGVSYIPLSFFMMGLPIFELSASATGMLSSLQLSIVVLMNIIFILGFFWTSPIKRNT